MLGVALHAMPVILQLLLGFSKVMSGEVWEHPRRLNDMDVDVDMDMDIDIDLTAKT